ncbi:MAG: hypothetical protein ACRDT1_14720 [Micromonosporaceae bacterium]
MTWRQVVSRRVRRHTPAWERYHGVTPDELRAVTETIGEVLPGRQLTREELTSQVVERAGGAVTVTITPFGAMPAKTRRGVEQHATRYESLFGAPARVSWAD